MAIRKRRGSEVNYELLARTSGSGVDPWHTFVQLVPHMVENARAEAEEYSASWRGFKVGGAMVAVASQEYRQGVVYGANSKPNLTKAKVCSEKRLFGATRKRGLDWPIGMVIVGKPNLDHGSGLKMPTLHPCEECRILLDEQAQPDTLVMTVGLEEDIYQIMTVDELLTLHNPNSQGEIAINAMQLHSDPGFQKWEESRKYYGFLANGFSVEIDGQLRRAETLSDAARIAITGTYPEQ